MPATHAPAIHIKTAGPPSLPLLQTSKSTSTTNSSSRRLGSPKLSVVTLPDSVSSARNPNSVICTGNATANKPSHLLPNSFNYHHRRFEPSPSTSPLTPKIEALLYRCEIVDMSTNLGGLKAVAEEKPSGLSPQGLPFESFPPSLSSGSTNSSPETSSFPPTPPVLIENRVPKESLATPSPSTPPSSSSSGVDPERRRSRSSSHSELAKTAVGLREIAKKIVRAQLIWDNQPRTVLIVTKIHEERLIRITKEVSKWLIKDLGMTVLVEDRLKEDPAYEYDELMADLAAHTHKEPSVPSGGSASGLDTASPDEPCDPLSFDHLRIRPTLPASSRLQFWDASFSSSAEASSSVDFVITLGGDGTVLFAAWMFQKKCPPILPFRLGSLGFLTTYDFTQFRSSVSNVVAGKGMQGGMRMNFRMRFSCTVLRHDTENPESSDHGKSFQILNDLTIDRGPSPYMSQLELFGNDSHLTSIHADGLTIATPTGSTAYSLSAGGSLVHPDVSAILVTPICPHTLSFRPMMLPDTMEVTIMVPPDSRTTAWASFDGRHRVCLQRGDKVVVRAGVWPVPTVCWEDQSRDWFSGLERCLGWNQRERQKGWGASTGADEGNVLDGMKW